MYPSYPPPIPLWAIGKPRRKFVPYFGKHYTPTTTTTTTTTTTPKPAVLDSSCSHLPSTCWNNSPYLPLPIECIGTNQNTGCPRHTGQISRMDDSRYLMTCDLDICAVSDPSALQPVMSACVTYPTGNLPLQCIEIIQVSLLFLGGYFNIFLYYRPCCGDRCH